MTEKCVCECMCGKSADADDVVCADCAEILDNDPVAVPGHGYELEPTTHPS